MVAAVPFRKIASGIAPVAALLACASAQVQNLAADSSADAAPRRPAPEVLRASLGNFDRRLLAFVPTYGGDAQERRRLLAACGAPLLVMRGQHSRILSPESAEHSASLVGGRVVEIPDAGHNVCLDNPEAVAEALRRFLAPLTTLTEGPSPNFR